MDKILLVLTILFIASGIFAGYSYYYGVIIPNTNGANNNSNTIVQEIEITPKDLAKFPPDPKENERIFKILKGEVKYTSTKANAPTDLVKISGKTSDVFGYGLWNQLNKTIQTLIYVDLRDLSSNNLARDSEILTLIPNKDAYFEMPKTEVTDELAFVNKPYTGKLTLNNVTKDVEFIVNGKVENDIFSFTGNAKINITDYKIEIPLTTDNPFAINPEIEISFTISGSSTNP